MPDCCATVFPVPRSSGCLRVTCGVINLIIPGLGLFILSTNYKQYRPDYNSYYGLIALLQFVLLFIAIGWIWAIINGFVMMVVGCAYGDKEFGALPGEVLGGANDQPAPQNNAEQGIRPANAQ